MRNSPTFNSALLATLTVVIGTPTSVKTGNFDSAKFTYPSNIEFHALTRAEATVQVC